MWPRRQAIYFTHPYYLKSESSSFGSSNSTSSVPLQTRTEPKPCRWQRAWHGCPAKVDVLVGPLSTWLARPMVVKVCSLPKMAGAAEALGGRPGAGGRAAAPTQVPSTKLPWGPSTRQSPKRHCTSAPHRSCSNSLAEQVPLHTGRRRLQQHALHPHLSRWPRRAVYGNSSGSHTIA